MKKNNQDNRKNVVFAAIAIATLIVAIIGATYAYFVAQVGSGATANVTLTTRTTDSLTFSTGSAITIGPVTQANFAQGAGNKSGSTTGTVQLKANANSSATYCYSAYLKVTTNNFVYSTAPTNTPELTVTAQKNSTTVLSSRDITTAAVNSQVNFPTALNGSTVKHTITATAGNTTTDNWTVTVTFVNLNSDQNSNTGKTFQATIYFENTAC